MSSAFRAPHSALLLLGPTGAGKTPLGARLEAHGLWGRPCRHFDFGARLRAVAAAPVPPAYLSPEDCAAIDRVLRTGALLEDAEFPIAARMLGAFLDALPAGTLAVLNGLPRHVGQAARVDALARVGTVAFLECTAAVVRARIRSDAGGDRAGRADDSPVEVERKLDLFRARTLPLVEHYRARGAAIEVISVGVATTPAEVVERLERRTAVP